MGFFDEILAEGGVPAEEQPAVRAVLAKYPGLEVAGEKRGLRQAEFSRKLDEHTAERQRLQAEVDEREAKLSEWEAWKDAAWDSEHNMTVAQWEATQRAQELEQRIQQGEDMLTFEQIESQLATKGYLKETELDKKVRPIIQPMVQNQAAGMELVYARTATVPMRYKEQFGEHIDMESYIQFAGQPQNLERLKTKEGAEQVYAEFTRNKVNERELADAKKRADEAEARLNERISQTADQHSPTGAPGGPPMGRIARRVMERAKGIKHEPLPGQLGDLTTASLAAEKAARGEYKDASQ